MGGTAVAGRHPTQHRRNCPARYLTSRGRTDETLDRLLNRRILTFIFVGARLVIDGDALAKALRSTVVPKEKTIDSKPELPPLMPAG